MATTSRVLLNKVTVITQPFHYAGQYGYDYDHYGVDLTSNNGVINVLDWITAHSDGKVVAIRTDCTGFEYGSYGNYVLLEHPNGMGTMYAHLAYGTTQVSYGQTVKAGQVLAYMDNTGTSYGGHLHWEVRNANGNMIDPAPYLNSDLPGMGADYILYQIYDDVHKTWQPNVKNDYDYAGIFGSDVDCVAANLSKGNVRYKVHTWGGDIYEKYPNSGWLPEVKNRTDFAGVKGRPIDGFMIIGDKALTYRVHLRKRNLWLPWVTGYDTMDAINGFAGILGQPIDAIQIKLK